MTTYLGKSCSFCLPRVPFVNCRQFMYLVISLLVLRAGYGIWLYQFLIIAYLFTLSLCFNIYENTHPLSQKLFLMCHKEIHLRVSTIKKPLNDAQDMQQSNLLRRFHNWASSKDYGTHHIGYQRRLRRAWAPAQSRQCLRCSYTWSMEVDEGSD